MSVTEIWSCGGGTQSGAIAALIKAGKLPKPDHAFMTDTGRERSSTWPFVDGYIRPALASVGVTLTIIKSADYNARTDVFWVAEDGGQSTLLPGFTTLNGGVGKLPPFCSGKWKRDVGERHLRAIGVEKARVWLGISRDESHRVRAPHRNWIDLWYPLIFEVPMTRAMCVDLIRRDGWTAQIPHSACWMCPNHSDAEWVDMRLNWPDDFQAACELEADARRRDPHFYLHPACVPLAEVDFFAQRSLLSERGCTEGCFT